MRKLSEGESSPKPPQKPALTSRNTENPRESGQIQRGF